jgi:hypothetical protein
MIKKVALSIMLMLTLSAMLLTSGCLLAAVGGGAGGVFYAKGDLETSVTATPAKVEAATAKAFAELEIAPISTTSSELEAKIIGRTTTDKKVTVISKLTGENISSISIRVGTFGDKDISQGVFQKIKKNL